MFPRRTSYMPVDDWTWVGYPPLSLFDWAFCEAIHVSVTFTWDISEAVRIAEAWEAAYPIAPVFVGGPAVRPQQPADGFVPGRYVKPGVTFTTRGCDNSCPWCLVPCREGRLRELDPISPGWIVQDNNLLQAGPAHLRKVWAMLKAQPRAAKLAGGLEAARITDAVADDLRGLRIEEVYLAADTAGAVAPLRRALDRLSFLPRDKRRVYVMVGYNGETIQAAEARLEAVWEVGGLPFCQLYQPVNQWIDYPHEWKALARTWSRPAAMAAMHKETTE